MIGNFQLQRIALLSFSRCTALVSAEIAPVLFDPYRLISNAELLNAELSFLENPDHSKDKIGDRLEEKELACVLDTFQTFPSLLSLSSIQPFFLFILFNSICFITILCISVPCIFHNIRYVYSIHIHAHLYCISCYFSVFPRHPDLRNWFDRFLKVASLELKKFFRGIRNRFLKRRDAGFSADGAEQHRFSANGETSQRIADEMDRLSFIEQARYPSLSNFSFSFYLASVNSLSSCPSFIVYILIFLLYLEKSSLSYFLFN